MTNKQPEALRLADKYAAQMMTAEFAKAYGTLAAVQRLSADAAQTRAELETLLRTQHALLERARDALFVWQNSDGWVWPETARKTANERTAELLAAITQHLEPK